MLSGHWQYCCHMRASLHGQCTLVCHYYVFGAFDLGKRYPCIMVSHTGLDVYVHLLHLAWALMPFKGLMLLLLHYFVKCRNRSLAVGVVCV